MAVYALTIPKGGAGKTTSGVHIIGELNPDLVIDMDVLKSLSIINQLRPDDKKWCIITVSSKEELLNILKQADSEGKTVLIDCGGFDADINRVAVAVADVILAPANDDTTEQIGLFSFEKMLGEISKRIGREITAHVFLCKTPYNQKHFPDMEDTLSKTKHLRLMQNRLSYRTGPYGFTKSLKKGLGITEIRHGRASAAGKEVIGLVKELRELAL